MARSDLRRHAGRALALALLAASAGCTRIDNALASLPFFAFMREAPSIDPYEMPRPSPPGAVPFESPMGAAEPAVPAGPQGLEQFAAWVGENPYPAEPRGLARGKAVYDRNCAVCHGVTGDGKGPVIGAGKFPFAPALLIPPATDRSDAYMYAVIRAGRGLMPQYGDRIPVADRWLVVNYVRYLQQKLPAGTAPDTTAAPPWVVTLPNMTQAAPAAGTAQGAK